MTTQRKDTILLDGKEHGIARDSLVGIFDIQKHGIYESGMNTGCYRGAVGRYELIDDYLYLIRLEIIGTNLAYKSIKKINRVFGKQAEMVTNKDSNRTILKNIRHKVADYTGYFYIVEYDQSVHPVIARYGFLPYTKVIFFDFQLGKLINKIDFSDAILNIRKDLENLNHWIESKAIMKRKYLDGSFYYERNDENENWLRYVKRVQDRVRGIDERLLWINTTLGMYDCSYLYNMEAS